MLRRFGSTKMPGRSRLLILAKFLESWIAAQRVPDRVQPQKRWCNNHWGHKEGVIVGCLQQLLESCDRPAVLAEDRLNERQVLFEGRSGHGLFSRGEKHDCTLRCLYGWVRLPE